MVLVEDQGVKEHLKLKSVLLKETLKCSCVGVNHRGYINIRRKKSDKWGQEL